MLYYPNIVPVVWIGTKNVTTFARTSVALTTAYTGNTKTKYVSGMSEMVLDILYTTGASETATTLDVQVQNSEDGTNFYTLTNESSSAGTSTLTARTFALAGGAGATAYAISYRLDISYKYIKVSVQEAGVVTNAGTIFVEGNLAGN